MSANKTISIVENENGEITTVIAPTPQEIAAKITEAATLVNEAIKTTEGGEKEGFIKLHNLLWCDAVEALADVVKWRFVAESR